MHTWSWQIRQEIPYLTCSLLDRWPHGFFTRLSWPQLPELLTSSIHPTAKVFRVKQVHGNRVLTSAEVLEHLQAPLDQDQDSKNNPAFPEADGVLSTQPQEAMWVCSADCTPVLIADERTGNVAAVHAGWRGTSAKVTSAAILQMQAQGSRIEDLRVAMGPAINGTVYQVSLEVAEQVVQSLAGQFSASQSEVQNLSDLQTLMNLPHSPILPDEEEGRVRLDVRQVNALQLQQLGLHPEQVAIAPHCTYQEPERFFSYRRDRLKQVQWSGIVSVESCG